MVTPTTGTPTSATEATNLYAAPEERSTLDREDFMKLFLAQLQYQDPMNPLDSAEMSSQMAQFNMVDLLYDNNAAMENLVKSDEMRTRLGAVNYLGLDVRYAGDRLPVGPDGPKAFDIELADPAAACTAVIRDGEGRVVRTLDLGALAPGKHPLAWDGADASGARVPEGDYRVSVQALDENGNELSVATWTTGTVDKVNYPESGLPRLTLAGGEEIGLDEIWMVGG
ncbi:hypothetical protein G3N55_06955 [Dissulfurirhabdus thermomarina]|uniref:Basal-body rod modification protein FlgD n=1 Tax=Dissulfurirhabdus thermomarina TaxID=1765737 RepID=A0A6N9TQ58_DISTH|nr:FlgD immunoglobulin-like domain containing protein [Dissulfurirhabdus thermomarina]NDY42580.1 hypothetical protein [Dissulfurirhabdus thermomarina]NMX22513.1 hypothetical protein [Dissulfurirhabdus thermomarina]